MELGLKGDKSPLDSPNISRFRGIKNMINPFQNFCDQSAVEALRFLAENNRPIGGQDQFNAEHLLQIANELEESIQNIKRELWFHRNS